MAYDYDRRTATEAPTITREPEVWVQDLTNYGQGSKAEHEYSVTYKIKAPGAKLNQKVNESGFRGEVTPTKATLKWVYKKLGDPQEGPSDYADKYLKGPGAKMVDKADSLLESIVSKATGAEVKFMGPEKRTYAGQW